MRAVLSIYLFFCFISCSSKNKETKTIVADKADEVVTAKSYAELKKETLSKRTYFSEAYEKNKEDAEKQEQVILEAQKYLLDVADEYFRAWYNTPWTFHGHSQTPREGSIACGYFITTTLQDMWFNIPRIKWAQQASEYIIKKMSSDIKRFRQRPMEEVVEYIRTKGEGLYIVGLDCHVGYIYYKDGKMSFVHANYYRPKIGVMSETLIGRNPLNDSKYRVIGKIFDKEMTRNWILNTPYST